MKTGHQEPQAIVGRYVLYGEIASGGMATVHYGRQLGHVGFSRTVAIKRMHSHCASDPDFASMFIDEAKLVARIRHPNVVPILDVVSVDGTLSLVMEYVHGETLSRLLISARTMKLPPSMRVVSAIMVGVLEGLHAAHEAVSEHGEPLGIVHRDVSPQNTIVGIDGVSRVLDFGIAKASVRLQTTRDGQLKGKLPYMAPEQIRNGFVDRRTDVYAASVVLWEALAGRRLYDGDNDAATMAMVLEGSKPPLRSLCPAVSSELEWVVLQGLAIDPSERFQSAQALAVALEEAVGVATPREVAGWVQAVAAVSVKKRSEELAEIESVSSNLDVLPLELAHQARRSGFDVRHEARSGPADLATATDVSSVVPSRSPEIPDRSASSGARPRRATLALLGGFVLAVVLVALVSVRFFLWRNGESMHPNATTSPVPTLPVLPLASVPPSSASAKPPDASGSNANTTMPTKTGEIQPKMGQTKRPASRSHATPSSDTLQPNEPNGDGCNPPYTINPEGLRVPKPECL